jgi:hypothetical protein
LAPESDDEKEYLAKLKNAKDIRNRTLKVPFSVILNQPSKYVQNPIWTPSSGNSIINPDFEYPVVLQAAMNSVVTEFNTRPHHPRLTAVTDGELLTWIEAFERVVKPCYDIISKKT